jgi:hypothetical protein
VATVKADLRPVRRVQPGHPSGIAPIPGGEKCTVQRADVSLYFQEKSPILYNLLSYTYEAYLRFKWNDLFKAAVV